MKQYTFEINYKVYEFYDLRQVKKKSLEFAKQLQKEVLVTMLNLNNYKQSWFTAYPDGSWTIDGKNLSFNN